MYKSNCEQKKLTSVIQMQKDSLNDIQKDYFSSHELEYNEAMKTYENIPPLLDITNQNGSTVVYNNKHRSRFMVQKNNTQNLMHSFDNILTPLETKTHYDQLSPFSSAKTLNKLGNTVQKSARKHNDTIICNRLANDVSESHRTFKERSVEKVATQNTFPHKNHQRCSSKNSVHSFKNNVSRSSSKLGSSIQSSSWFANVGERPSLQSSVIKSSSKYSLSKYNTEPRSCEINSLTSEDGPGSFRIDSAHKKGKMRIINREKQNSKSNRAF